MRLSASRSAARRYALSCGLLVLPVLLWNLALARRLPPAYQADEFWRDIPFALAVAEQLLRLLVIGLPFLMPLQLGTTLQRRGMALFVSGSLLYAAAWVALIAAPTSAWATSAIGFLAPAYTPLLWLAGIALIGRRLFWGDRYRWWVLLVLSVAFVAVHLGHAAIVFARNH